MHAYAAAAHRYHGCDLLQRQESHTLKEHRQLWMLVHQLYVHIGVLGAARDEHRHPVFAVFALEGGARHGTVLGVVVAVVVFKHAEVSQLVQQGVEAFFRRCVVFLAVQLMQLAACPVFTHLERIAGKHVQQEVQRGFAGDCVHLILEDTGQAPVFGSLGGHLYLSGNAVCDVAHQLYQLGVGVFVSKMFGDKLI